MPVFALFVTFDTGYVQVLTFHSAEQRAFEMIRLAEAPVTLRIKDYR